VLTSTVCYFLVSVMMYVLPSVDYNFTIGFGTPMQCIASVAVGRMMMNIRGLIMEDPEHTTHLQTLQFVTRTNAGSEIEERMEVYNTIIGEENVWQKMEDK